MSCFYRKSVLVAGLLCFPGSAAFAAPPSLWAGVVAAEDGRPTRVVATIDGEKISLRFGEPANCSIVAGLLQVAKGATVYRFSVPQNGGGFCERLYPGELSVVRDTDDSVDVVFRRQKIPWSGVLHRAIDP
ncbi:hypothetical protein [Luteibacter yeojuensis]|uniref:Uncharacterized protein n=1 Tax=Luteibacter yeojuensis TaxID=345309 RepID=A0A7X5TR27_9GAMM|nr:hypothetical protein [Luteibacter yeojuensis]NID16097.1 hypothetical protein [Luteibacter yeojuensis]